MICIRTNGSSTLGGHYLKQLYRWIKAVSFTSGDTTGLRILVNGSVSSAKVLWSSLASKLSDYIKDVVSSTGELSKEG